MRFVVRPVCSRFQFAERNHSGGAFVRISESGCATIFLEASALPVSTMEEKLNPSLSEWLKGIRGRRRSSLSCCGRCRPWTKNDIAFQAAAWFCYNTPERSFGEMKKSVAVGWLLASGVWRLVWKLAERAIGWRVPCMICPRWRGLKSCRRVRLPSGRPSFGRRRPRRCPLPAAC